MATGTTEHAPRKWLRRLGWLALLWAAGVASVSVATLLLRYLMAWAGLTR